MILTGLSLRPDGDVLICHVLLRRGWAMTCDDASAAGN
jgi:hypothetical protein